MLETFKNHIEKNFPFLQESQFIVACSGGLDSTVLAHLCKKSGYQFALAHCNFKLRGAESDGDAQFVEALAGALSVPYFSKSFDTLAIKLKQKGSTQMIARDLRYAWFSKLVAESQYQYVLSAHHLDDRLETFIINLSRGTGIDGLKGIPARQGTIVRPLLPFSRAELAMYAKQERIDWRDDSSNASADYLRNKIRHDIVPSLKGINESFLSSIAKTQDFLSGSAAILDKHKEQLQADLFRTEGKITKIAIEPLRRIKPLKPYLQLLFKEYGFTAWDDITHLLDSTSGKGVDSTTHRLLKDRNHLLLTVIQKKEVDKYHIFENQQFIKEPFLLQLSQVKEISDVNTTTIYVDAEKLTFPLVLRKWKRGDYFYPFGMVGRKKVSKFFKDVKMDAFSKESQWLLCSGEQIVWIVGKRADNRFCITKKTKQIIKLEIDR